MVCRVTRSKVKVMRPSKLENWPFSKCISSPIFNASWQMTVMHRGESRGLRVGSETTKYIWNPRPSFAYFFMCFATEHTCAALAWFLFWVVITLSVCGVRKTVWYIAKFRKIQPRLFRRRSVGLYRLVHQTWRRPILPHVSWFRTLK